MSRTVALGPRSIEYAVRESVRAKKMRVTVFPGGKVVVTAPARMPGAHIDRFLVRHSRWLERTLTRLEHKPERIVLPQGKHAYSRDRTGASILVRGRLGHFNAQYHFKILSFSIRNQKSRWGSCSHRGLLSFNFRIVHLPAALADYIVVHELCHFHALDHSGAFWNEVDKVLPDYQERKDWLRNNGAGMDL